LATVDCAAKKDTQEGSRNTSKGKGKAVVKSPPDEPKGPHTRTAARRKVASEKDAEVKPPDDQSSSEV
jgi:E3 ubiquitin-protein ligase TRIP12